jgi:DNA-binding NtrC family response regulator
VSNIWIVSDKSELEYPLSQLMSNRINCEIHTFSEIEPNSICSRGFGPDILVLDIESVPVSMNWLLKKFVDYRPYVPVVALSHEKCFLSNDYYKKFTIDEFIVHPENELSKGQTAEQLIRKVDVFENILSVQAKLHKEMNESRIVAKSESMREVLQKLPHLASTVSTVLIEGETGTGKELIARAIHYLGPRAGKPFIIVDCGSLPENLIENELFGHARGSYTDAGSAAGGLIQEANGGTLFLDEVEALPLNVQTRLLRFLQNKEVKPIGQAKYSILDIRVLAATNMNLKELVSNNLFRKDLYYRLNVVPLHIPPLREWKSDIPSLVQHFLKRHGSNMNENVKIPDEILNQWMEYPWPGNVRELENSVQEWLYLSQCDVEKGSSGISGGATQAMPFLSDIRKQSLEICEKEYLYKLLTQTKGNISAAARIAKIDRKNLRLLIKKHGYDPRNFNTMNK